MRGDDVGTVRFRFLDRPEYLQLGRTILIRESETKGYGKITRIHYNIACKI